MYIPLAACLRVTRMLDWATRLLGGWLSTLLLVLFIALLLSGKLGGRPKNFPPGMMILPFFGSLMSMPFGPSTETLRGLRKKYGDMASFGIFGNRIVLVSSVRLMKEVFNLKVTTYRPEMIISTARNKIISNGRTSEIGILGTNGEVWQKQRRFVLHHLRDLGFGKTSYEPIMVEEVAELIDHLGKEEGKNLEMKRLFNRSVLNILWGMFMGKRYSYDNPKLKKLLETFFQPADFNLLTPLHHIPYIFHVLPYIPILKKELNEIKTVTEFIKEEFKEFLACEELKNSDNVTAIYLREIERKENPDFNMDQLVGLIFDMFVAGMETTSSTLATGVNLLAKHPLVQRRLQEELDEVVGRDRLPSLADMERLPYVQATICEIQRIFNLAKPSLPHMTNENCKLGGYDIPKGTWLLANLDDALTNPEHWKNPREFDPQNFLDENGKFKKSDAFLPFGVGKRLCVGAPLAKLELFLFISNLFQRFTFTLLEERTPLSEANPCFNAPPVYTAIAECRPAM